MSTLKVTNIENPSTTSGGIDIDTSGHVTVDGVAMPSAGPLSNRNLIINGGFQVAQRGTARVFSSSYTTLDRWAPGEYQQAGYEQVSVSDSTVPTVKAIRVTSSSTAEQAAGTRMAVGQMIESVNCVHLAGKTVTLSFYIRFSNATFTNYGTFRYYLNEYDTTADQNFGTTNPTRNNNTTITNGSLPTTWTKYTTTVTCGSAMRNLAPRFMFDGLANTTNSSDLWYEVTAVQVEEGSVATLFEHRSFGDELVRCYRYFQKSYAHDIAPGTVTSGNRGNDFVYLMGGSTSPHINLKFNPEMRITPNITAYSTANANTTGKLTASSTDYSVGTNSIVNSPRNFLLFAGGVTAADDCYVAWTANAEL